MRYAVEFLAGIMTSGEERCGIICGDGMDDSKTGERKSAVENELQTIKLRVGKVQNSELH
jgi:hypothetical protein